ncbi:MAG: hypothetical protein P1U89_19055 [Verrucomicrobiales bacterium]|nr:hypothetical protein [Verrucomicrobiales bacterium]
MDFENPIQTFIAIDPLYLVAIACALIALFTLRLAISLPAKIAKLTKAVRNASDHIAVADEARKREATLTAVRRFESDPEIRNAVRHIWQKTKTPQGVDYSLLDSEDRFHVVSYLNYLDGVACGLKQGVLDEPVAKDYLQHVIHKSVPGLILGESGESWKAGKPLVDPEPFENLILLYKKWGIEEVHPLFKMMGHGVTR